jgi:hypothetical protein
MRTLIALLLTLAALPCRGQFTLGAASYVSSFSVATNAVPADVKQDYAEGAWEAGIDYFNWYYYASWFIASNSYTLHAISFKVITNGVGTFTVTPHLFNDNAGQPGTLLDTGTAQSITNAPTSADWWRFEGFDCSLTNGSRYWVSMQASVWAASYQLIWGAQVEPDVGVWRSDNGTSWSVGLTTIKGLFRTYGQ